MHEKPFARGAWRCDTDGQMQPLTAIVIID